MIGLVSVTMNLGEEDGPYVDMLVKVVIPDEVEDGHAYALEKAKEVLKPFLNNSTHYFTGGVAFL